MAELAPRDAFLAACAAVDAAADAAAHAEADAAIAAPPPSPASDDEGSIPNNLAITHTLDAEAEILVRDVRQRYAQTPEAYGKFLAVFGQYHSGMRPFKNTRTAIRKALQTSPDLLRRVEELMDCFADRGACCPP
jgi:histone deacetylase complex regulatory component SIN3